MVRLLRIERAITWIAKALTANRDANPTPEGVLDVILPSVDIFGTQRIDNVRFESVLGALGDIEVVHSLVPIGFYRHYLSMEYEHNAVVPTLLTSGRVVAQPVIPFFPYAMMQSEGVVGATVPGVIRNFLVPPNARAAARVTALGGGRRISTWVRLTVRAPSFRAWRCWGGPGRSPDSAARSSWQPVARS